MIHDQSGSVIGHATVGKVPNINSKNTPPEVQNFKSIPVRGSWRRSGVSGSSAGLRSIAPLWAEGSTSPGAAERVRTVNRSRTEVQNFKSIPVRGSWRRSGVSGGSAGLRSIAPLWAEGSTSPGAAERVRTVNRNRLEVHNSCGSISIAQRVFRADGKVRNCTSH